MNHENKRQREDIEMICIISHFVVALFSYFEVKKQKAKLFRNIRCFSALLWSDISFKGDTY